MKNCPLSLGQSFQFVQVMTDEIHRAFIICSRDTNPLHVDDDYARRQNFSGKLMHGALLNAMISGLVGTGLPTSDTMCLMQKINFKRPFFLNDEITLIAKVTALQESPASEHWIAEMSLKFLKDQSTIATGTVELMVG